MTVAKPDKSCFVSFYQHIRRFRIYGKDGELKRDVILDILPGQERPEVDDYLRFIHPISVYATDSYIYTLNLDMTTEEIENRKTTPNIQVFDWEGKPLTQYKLDCFINTFVVDEVANKIYGVFVEDEDHIYVFKFMRVYSKRKDRCGAVLTIMEIQKCASFQEIFKEDSIWASTDTTQVKVIYKSVNSKNGVKKMAFTSYKAERHPETNELSALQKAEWYLQGRENVYYISFTSCSLFLELLPQIKDIVASLKEL